MPKNILIIKNLRVYFLFESRMKTSQDLFISMFESQKTLNLPSEEEGDFNEIDTLATYGFQ